MTMLRSTDQVDSDDALVARVVRGETAAFAELVERHEAVVLRVAARIVGREEAQDVSQDAFLRAFHRLSRYRGEGSFRAWLLQITHNAAVSAATHRRPEAVDAEAATAEDPSPDGERLPAVSVGSGRSGSSASSSA